jgi:hypothetical protein
VQITSLEERKQEAIRRENYDDAKVINEEIKRLRTGGPTQPPARQAPMKLETRNYEEEGMNAVSPVTNNRTMPAKNVQPLQEKPRQPERREAPQPVRGKPMKEEDDDDRPLNNKNPNPYSAPP